MQNLQHFERESLEKKYNSARLNLLLVVAFTAINTLLLAIQNNTYFLFSAFVPYFLVQLGMEICGMFPPEYYGSDYYFAEFLPPTVFYFFLAVAIVITAVYLVCWIFSKKHSAGWLIAALVLFSLDTLVMLGFAFLGGTEVIVESAIDIVLHIWVVISLVTGISACSRLKAQPAPDLSDPVAFGSDDEEDEEDEDEPLSEQDQNAPDTPILRRADRHAKHRMLLSAKAMGHEIEYRRVKRTNELVIDGNVYAEYTALLEQPHALSAILDGHRFEVGYNGAHSYFRLDGQTVAQKMRVF